MPLSQGHEKTFSLIKYNAKRAFDVSYWSLFKLSVRSLKASRQYAQGQFSD
jgi:hypothetical protein